MTSGGGSLQEGLSLPHPLTLECGVNGVPRSGASCDRQRRQRAWWGDGILGAAGPGMGGRAQQGFGGPRTLPGEGGQVRGRRGRPGQSGGRRSGWGSAPPPALTSSWVPHPARGQVDAPSPRPAPAEEGFVEEELPGVGLAYENPGEGAEQAELGPALSAAVPHSSGRVSGAGAPPSRIALLPPFPRGPPSITTSAPFLRAPFPAVASGLMVAAPPRFPGRGHCSFCIPVVSRYALLPLLVSPFETDRVCSYGTPPLAWRCHSSSPANACSPPPRWRGLCGDGGPHSHSQKPVCHTLLPLVL